MEYEGAKIHLLPCPRRGRALLLFQRDVSYFRPLFRELRPDLVHGWGTEDSFAWVARRLALDRHVIGIQGLIGAYRKRTRMPARTFLTAMTEKWSLAKAQYVVAESEYSLREAATLCPAETKLRVIEQALRREFLHATPTDYSTATVLFVGTIEERKGIGAAIEAFARAAAPDWTLHVIGSGTEREEQAMQHLAEKRQLKRRFRYTRTCSASELVTAMQASSVFILPTRIDTGPTALKEALTMGLWPICYDNSGPGEYLRKYHFGSLASDNNLDSLSENLQQILSSQPWKTKREHSTLASKTREDFAAATAWRNLSMLYGSVVLSSKLD